MTAQEEATWQILSGILRSSMRVIASKYKSAFVRTVVTKVHRSSIPEGEVRRCRIIGRSIRCTGTCYHGHHVSWTQLCRLPAQLLPYHRHPNALPWLPATLDLAVLVSSWASCWHLLSFCQVHPSGSIWVLMGVGQRAADESCGAIFRGAGRCLACPGYLSSVVLFCSCRRRII